MNISAPPSLLPDPNAGLAPDLAPVPPNGKAPGHATPHPKIPLAGGDAKGCHPDPGPDTPENRAGRVPVYDAWSPQDFAKLLNEFQATATTADGPVAATDPAAAQTEMAPRGLHNFRIRAARTPARPTAAKILPSCEGAARPATAGPAADAPALPGSPAETAAPEKAPENAGAAACARASDNTRRSPTVPARNPHLANGASVPGLAASAASPATAPTATPGAPHPGQSAWRQSGTQNTPGDRSRPDPAGSPVTARALQLPDPASPQAPALAQRGWSTPPGPNPAPAAGPPPAPPIPEPQRPQPVPASHVKIVSPVPGETRAIAGPAPELAFAARLVESAADPPQGTGAGEAAVDAVSPNRPSPKTGAANGMPEFFSLKADPEGAPGRQPGTEEPRAPLADAASSETQAARSASPAAAIQKADNGGAADDRRGPQKPEMAPELSGKVPAAADPHANRLTALPWLPDGRASQSAAGAPPPIRRMDAAEGLARAIHGDSGEPVAAQAPGAARDITLRLSAQNQPAVDVRVVERAGEVRVAVRSSDAQLAESMRAGVSQLAEHLEQRGFQTEIWHPQPLRTGGGSQPGFHQQEDSHASGRGFSDGGERQSRRHPERGRQPLWLEELEKGLNQSTNRSVIS